MEIVGYIGYGVLVILAIVWTVGVRTQLGAGTHTILGTLYFVVGAVIIPAFGINMLHALWVIPVGFLFMIIVANLVVRTRGVSYLFRRIAGIYSDVVRIGISRQRIEAAKARTHETVDDYFDKQE